MDTISQMEFFPNRNRSVEFAVKGTVCLGRILDERIEENSQGADARDAYDAMLAADCPINILDFSRVIYINAGAWGRFVVVLRALWLQGRRLRIFGFAGQPLERYKTGNYDLILPRYARFDDAVLDVRALTHTNAERAQAEQIALWARAAQGGES